MPECHQLHFDKHISLRITVAFRVVEFKSSVLLRRASNGEMITLSKLAGLLWVRPFLQPLRTNSRKTSRTKQSPIVHYYRNHGNVTRTIS